MAVNLSIKGVPDELAARLRARAERHHRSLQGELMAIVDAAVREEGAGVEGPAARATPASAVAGSRSPEDIVAELWRRFPEPASGVPQGVDIVREDRDRR